MKRKQIILLGTLFTTTLATAQDFGIQSTLQKILNEVAGAFVPIALIGLVAVGAVNIKHFTGENGDTAKGIGNIIKYLIFLMIVVGIYQFAKTQIRL